LTQRGQRVRDDAKGLVANAGLILPATLGLDSPSRQFASWAENDEWAPGEAMPA